MSRKPLGRKAYGSIGHLPSSRLGPTDRHVHEGQQRICTEKARDRHDVVIVQEKLDGSCCAVARVGGELVALGRSGYLAQTSPFEQHHLFAHWVRENRDRFEWLDEGERVVGEWLAQAHGTIYELHHEPFVPFDVMRDHRIPFLAFKERVHQMGLAMPATFHIGGPLSIDKAQECIRESFHGAVDPVEGVVYRVERRGVVDFLAKWVRPDKQDGKYLPELTGGEAVWNWRPK